MINPFYFTDGILKTVLKFNLHSHKIYHVNFILTIISNYTDFGVEKTYIKKIFNGMSNIYHRLVNQNKFKYHTIFSASFHEFDEEYQRND